MGPLESLVVTEKLALIRAEPREAESGMFEYLSSLLSISRVFFLIEIISEQTKYG